MVTFNYNEQEKIFTATFAGRLDTLAVQRISEMVHINLPVRDGKTEDTIVFIRALLELGIRISRSKKASPWENGYQESFYSQFKVDLGDPERFKTLGELVYEIHHCIWTYNNTRIHSALRMPPKLFAKQYQKVLEKVS